MAWRPKSARLEARRQFLTTTKLSGIGTFVWGQRLSAAAPYCRGGLPPRQVGATTFSLRPCSSALTPLHGKDLLRSILRPAT